MCTYKDCYFHLCFYLYTDYMWMEFNSLGIISTVHITYVSNLKPTFIMYLVLFQYKNKTIQLNKNSERLQTPASQSDALYACASTLTYSRPL